MGEQKYVIFVDRKRVVSVGSDGFGSVPDPTEVEPLQFSLGEVANVARLAVECYQTDPEVLRGGAPIGRLIEIMPVLHCKQHA